MIPGKLRKFKDCSGAYTRIRASENKSGGTEMSQKDGIVVMVHGAWADGSSWRKVINALCINGIKAVTVPLPLTSFADDLAALGRTLERVDGPVLLRPSDPWQSA
jgi:hypothetical protein